MGINNCNMAPKKRRSNKQQLLNLSVLASEVSSMTLFGILCFLQAPGLDARKVFVSYALVDLMLTPAKTLFSWGTGQGWVWFLPPFGVQNRITLQGFEKVRPQSFLLWLGCVSCLGIFLYNGTEWCLSLCFVLHSVFVFEDTAFWMSHLVFSMAAHCLLCSPAHFDVAVLFSLCRIWFFSGVVKFFPEFWAAWHPFTLFSYSPIYSRVLAALGSGKKKHWLLPHVKVFSFMGAVSETLLSILMLFNGTAGLVLSCAMHLYIIGGMFAPMIWNTITVLIAYYTAYTNSLGITDVINLVTTDMWTSYGTLAYVLYECLLIVAVISSNLGVCWAGFWNSNFHGGNWANRHVFVRRSVMHKCQGLHAPRDYYDVLQIWQSDMDPVTNVSYMESFQRSALACPDEFVLVPFEKLWKVLGLWWNFAYMSDFAQAHLVKHFGDLWKQEISSADFAIVALEPITWLRSRKVKLTAGGGAAV